MPMDNYPGGFKEGIIIRGIPLQVTHPGKVFWVSNSTAQLPNQKTGSDGNDGSFNAPFATIDYAIGKCTANRGDVIMVKPGHAETISSASAITLDVAGVAVVGFGYGSMKPTITFDTADTTDIVISAANVTLYNLTFSANFADIVRAINITAANARIINCDFRDTAVNMNWLTPIKSTSTTDNTADGLVVQGNTWFSVDAAGLEFIEVNADVRYGYVVDNIVVHEGTNSPLILSATGKDWKYATILRNYLSMKDTGAELFLDIDTTGTNNSGIVAYNLIGHADVTGAHGIFSNANGFRLFENRSTSVNNLSGLLLPAADVDL